MSLVYTQIYNITTHGPPDCGCFAWWISWLKFGFRDKDFLGFSNLSIFLMLYFLYN